MAREWAGLAGVRRHRCPWWRQRPLSPVQRPGAGLGARRDGRGDHAAGSGAAAVASSCCCAAGRRDQVAGGAFYVGVPTLSLVWLRNGVAGGLEHVLWLLLVVWATDICAYFVGRTFGGPKLAPRISPGKTWSGLLGGMGGAGLLGGLAAWLCGRRLLASPPGRHRAGRGRPGAATCSNSTLKRRAGVKDSGQLIPGHGGLLDRIDGLVFAAPAFAASSGSWAGAACHDGPPGALGRSPAQRHHAGCHGLDRAQHAVAVGRGARAVPGRGGDRLSPRGTLAAMARASAHDSRSWAIPPATPS